MTQLSLDALTVTPKTGDDRFIHQGQDVGANLLGFWRWSCSDLVGNVMRGILAEYIVGLALGCVDGGVRPEWDATDLCFQGCRVEVKSSASPQSWSQTQLSPIKFDIEPNRMVRGDEHLCDRTEASSRRVRVLRLDAHR